MIYYFSTETYDKFFIRSSQDYQTYDFKSNMQDISSNINNKNTGKETGHINFKNMLNSNKFCIGEACCGKNTTYDVTKKTCIKNNV